MQPLISVVIPVYNEEKRIGRAIESMQKQTYPNLEIIVVDDGSTDGTQAAVEKIARQDSRVTFHKNPNLVKRTNWRGYDINAGYAARNYGFKIAKGEWITTQDADDSSLLNRIEVQYEFAKKYNATLVAVQWQQLNKEWEGKKLDIERVLREKGEAEVVIGPEAAVERARRNRGVLMIEPLHKFIPFSIKWFPYTRKLFYRRTEPYLGADNCIFFHRQVRDKDVYFRTRNERTWGVPSGRGTGRDFAYRVAAEFKNSWTLKLPLYLWDVKLYNEEYRGYETYLI